MRQASSCEVAGNRTTLAGRGGPRMGAKMLAGVEGGKADVEAEEVDELAV